MTTSVTETLIREHCDKCGVPAKVRMKLDCGELVFCGHHYHELKDKLKDRVQSVEHCELARVQKARL